MGGTLTKRRHIEGITHGKTAYWRDHPWSMERRPIEGITCGKTVYWREHHGETAYWRDHQITGHPWRDGLLKRSPVTHGETACWRDHRSPVTGHRSPMERRPIEEITGHRWQDGLLKRSPMERRPIEEITHGKTAYWRDHPPKDGVYICDKKTNYDHWHMHTERRRYADQNK